MLQTLLGLLNLLGVGLVVALAMSVVHTAWSLRRPPKRTYAWAMSRRLPGDPGEMTPARAYDTFWFDGAHGRLPAWRVPGDDPAGPVVVMTHGWGSSRVGGLTRLRAIVGHAREVILWDQPGHGEAPGSARMGVDEHLDLLALLASLGTERAPVVLFGWSMGAGVSLRAAQENAGSSDQGADIRAVVCEAPYVHPSTPARNVMRLRGMPYRLNLPPAMAALGISLGVGPRWRGFARDGVARSLGTLPVVVIHGDADPVSPVADGRAIADAAPNGRLVVIPGGGHNNLWSDPVLAGIAGEALREALRGGAG